LPESLAWRGDAFGRLVARLIARCPRRRK
jgi:hypothetical protein